LPQEADVSDPLSGSHPEADPSRSPLWRRCLGPVALAASLLFLPVTTPEAEAAPQRPHARNAAQAQPPAQARRAFTARKPAKPSPRGASARRPDIRRFAAEPQPSQRQRTEEAVRAALVRAEQESGLSLSLLHRIAERESRLNPSARNARSSATGLMQFTRDTWLEVVRDFGPAQGLAAEAALLRTDRDGAVGTRDGRASQAILRLRHDPTLSAVLAAQRLRKARPALEEAMGRPARPVDLYLVHLLGQTGARRFLSALRDTPRMSSVAVVGDEVANSNGNVFQRDGRPLSVATVYNQISTSFAPPNPERALVIATSDP
jgi:hypothetical protein